VEEIAKQITIITSHGVEIAAAGIIGIAIFKVLFRYLSVFPIPKKMLSKEKIRVEFGSSVAVALELMLGADVLATAVAPSWNDIGQLAAIAIIRTALNYFLGKELKEIRMLSGEWESARGK
jgi:Predicted membrane protein